MRHSSSHVTDRRSEKPQHHGVDKASRSGESHRAGEEMANPMMRLLRFHWLTTRVRHDVYFVTPASATLGAGFLAELVADVAMKRDVPESAVRVKDMNSDTQE